jgi:hypothetical protein
VMSARFERTGQQDQPGTSGPDDSATIWESLSRDVDPTDDRAEPDESADVVEFGPKFGPTGG